MAANERSSLLSSPRAPPVFMTTDALEAEDHDAPRYEAPPPTVATEQFPVSQHFEKRSVYLDIDITFLATSVTTLVLPQPRKLRLQISPDDCVYMLSPLILKRVRVPPPFTYRTFVAKTSRGYELAAADPVGEVADRGDFLRVELYVQPPPEKCCCCDIV